MGQPAKPRRPKALKATYLGVARVFEQLEGCRITLDLAGKNLIERSDSLRYRDTLDALVRLEAQADALAYCFQISRADLKKWVADTEAYYRKLETVL